MPQGVGPRRGSGSQAWRTFIRNHAQSVPACDFFVAVTATFRTCDVFVVLAVGTRRLVHWNVTEHPTAAWTAQQFRMIILGDQPHRFLIHHHDNIFSDGVDRTVAAMGLTVSKHPYGRPRRMRIANA